MIRNIKRTWFEIWGAEEAQNRLLKALLLFLLTLCLTQTVTLTILALRTPPLIAVSSTESRVLSIIPPKPELFEAEVKRAASAYILAHYNWEWNKIDDAFKSASRFVHPDFTKKFLAANEAQIKISKEKKVSERFYLSETFHDPKTKTIQVSGDRILIVEGLRAANPMQIAVEYDFGPRTENNPEGVYITGERLVSLANDGSSR